MEMPPLDGKVSHLYSKEEQPSQSKRDRKVNRLQMVLREMLIKPESRKKSTNNENFFVASRL